MSKTLKDLLMRFTSRKFLLALSATLGAYLLAGEDGVFTASEIQTVIAPALAYIGLEGFADIKGR